MMRSLPPWQRRSVALILLLRPSFCCLGASPEKNRTPAGAEEGRTICINTAFCAVTCSCSTLPRHTASTGLTECYTSFRYVWLLVVVKQIACIMYIHQCAYSWCLAVHYTRWHECVGMMINLRPFPPPFFVPSTKSSSADFLWWVRHVYFVWNLVSQWSSWGL